MRKSVFELMSKEELEKTVRESGVLSDVLIKAGLKNKGTGNYTTLKRYLKKYGIDYQHLLKNGKSLRVRHLKREEVPLEDIFIKDCKHNRSVVKRRILKNRLIKLECSICGQGSEWNGNSLVMVLDHINGVRDDNRIENLRMLCPNCNSQQETFAGRNNKGEDCGKRCVDCGCVVSFYSTRCKKCDCLVKRQAFVRPSVQVLREEVAKSGFEATGRKHGVSGNTIRNWIG